MRLCHCGADRAGRPPRGWVRSSLVAATEILVDIVRSGFVEGHHRGSVVALTSDGEIDWSIGDVTSPIYPRSCNKPVQALGMLRSGLDLDGDLLALACASHSGEDFHIDGVRRILASAGLDETALQTPPDYPLDEDGQDGVHPQRTRQDADRDELLGQARRHARDVRGQRVGPRDLPGPEAPGPGGDRADLRGEHGRADRQCRAWTAVVRRCSRRRWSAWPERSGRSWSPTRAPSNAAIVDAIVANPEFTSGSTRDEAALLRAIPGAIGKAGAESCYAVALPDGRAVALKVEDGSPRARPPVMAAALRRMGLESDAVAATGVTPLYGGGEPVGELRPVF